MMQHRRGVVEVVVVYVEVGLFKVVEDVVEGLFDSVSSSENYY